MNEISLMALYFFSPLGDNGQFLEFVPHQWWKSYFYLWYFLKPRLWRKRLTAFFQGRCLRTSDHSLPALLKSEFPQEFDPHLRWKMLKQGWLVNLKAATEVFLVPSRCYCWITVVIHSSLCLLAAKWDYWRAARRVGSQPACPWSCLPAF